MPRQVRTLTVTLDSAMGNVTWAQFVREITDVAELAACDYAAVSHDDYYTVTVQPAVEEGWWNRYVKSGQVHDHTPNMPMTMHRTCEQVYTKR